jgi:hypothetical protein
MVGLLFFYLHCRVDKLLDELKNGTLPNVFDYIIFFKGFKNMEINISLNNFEHFMDFEAPMSDKCLGVNAY